MATSPYFSRIRTPSDDRSRNASVLPKLSSQGNLIAGATARVGIGFLLKPVFCIEGSVRGVHGALSCDKHAAHSSACDLQLWRYSR